MRVLDGHVKSAPLTFSGGIEEAASALVPEPTIVLPLAAPADAARGESMGAAAAALECPPRPKSHPDGMVFYFLAAVVAALTAVVVTAALTVISAQAAAVTFLMCLTGLVALVGTGQCVEVGEKPLPVVWLAGGVGLLGVGFLLAAGAASVSATVVCLGLGGVLAWLLTADSMTSRPQPRKRVAVVARPDDLFEALSRLSGLADPVVWLAPDQFSKPFPDGEVAPGQRFMHLGRRAGIDTVIVDSRSRVVGEPLARLSALGQVCTIEEFLEETGQFVLPQRFSYGMVMEASGATGFGYRMGRAIMDLVAGVAALVLLATVGWIIVLAIKIDSPGPALYRQRRLGLHGREFHILKFRTMRADAESAGAMFAVAEDPRITAVGRFLRRSRLDELPQAINLLRRDMGLIGPRPERPEFVAQFRREIPGYDHRHTVRPGLTGWAQVTEGYADDLESTRRKVARDLYYLKRRNASLDCRIVLQTARCFLLLGGR